MVRLSLCLLSALSLASTARSMASTAPGAEKGSTAGHGGVAYRGPSSPEPPAPALRADLDQLLEQELHGDPDDLWSSDPAFALQVMILRAGRELPPTASAARLTEREAMRKAALDWLRARLDTDPTFRESWSLVTRALLEDFEQEVLWRATARTAGRLQEYGLASLVAAGLGSERPELAHAARGALFDLYLAWFEDAASFEAFWDETAELCDGKLYRERALEFERQARELNIKVLEYEPQRAATILGSPDPRMRAAAARVLGRSINGEGQAAVELLLAHLANEIDGAAFHATVEALLETQAAAAPDDQPLVALRARISEVMRDGAADLQGPAAHALGRTPWSTTAADESSILVGVDLLSAQLERLSTGSMLTDRDVLVTSLQALWTLGGRAARAGLDLRPRVEPVRDVVLRSIREEREFEGVRVAAARLLPIVGHPEDIQVAVEVMDAPGTSAELGYTLLADVGEMARGLSPDEPAGELALRTLLGRLSMQDPDLRRRALSFLTDEDLAGLTDRADARSFIEGLGVESLPELQSQLLSLVAELGDASSVDQLLGLANFDDIANSGPAGISSLVQTLERLANGDPALILRTAERLLAVDNDGTRVARLRESLVLVARLDAEAAAGLPYEDQDRIVVWARELRQSGGAMPGGIEFLRRLVDVHIPGCVQAEVKTAPNLAHLQALFLSDLVALDPEAGEVAQVLGHFEAARAFAVSRGRATEETRVLRDRARFHLKQGSAELALADYRAVFATELAGSDPEATPLGSSSVLDLSDLRGGGELVAASSQGAEAATALAREALAVSLSLLSREAWSREPVAVRVQDLRDLADRALRASSIEACDLALPSFAGLPELPPAPVEGETPTPLPPAPAGARWDGLLAEHVVHEELLALILTLNEQRAALESAASESVEEPEPSTPEAPEEDPPPQDVGDVEESPAEDQTPSEGPPATRGPDGLPGQPRDSRRYP